MNLAVLGGGSWGTALAIVLAPRAERIRLWVYERELAARMALSRDNDVYLPGAPIPPQIEILTKFAETLDEADFVLVVVPSRFIRATISEALPHLNSKAVLVSATKGLEHDTLLRMSQVIDSVISGGRSRAKSRLAVISGPTFAREVSRGEPAALVVASANSDTAGAVQKAFSGPTFRLYTHADPTGVELGGALKNVIAIAAGVVQGLGLGNNTMAALITRGLAEISRLAVAMGGDPLTLAGLAGLGDLVLTCTGDLSRNRRVGLDLARGKTLDEIVASTPMIAEGVETCASAVALGKKFSVELPIIMQMERVLHHGKPPREAIRDLMDRSLKGE